jgi:hypothetical protein
MPLSSNQEVEKYYFQLFSDHFPLPSGEIEYSDKPDVVINGSKKIGIEIANLYLADGSDYVSEQVQRQRRQKVVELAQSDYESKHNFKYELAVSFNPSEPIVDTQTTAKKLAEFATFIESTEGGFFIGKNLSHIPEIHSIYRSFEEYSDSKWRTLQVYDGKDLQIPRVRELVQQKSKKLSGYRQCDSYWLLLIVDFMDFAQDQEIDWPVGEPPVECKYERVIIYKPQFKKYLDIPINNILLT